MNELIFHIDMSQSSKTVVQEIDEVWGKYNAYHVFNVPETDYVTLYENLAEYLGEIRMCHSANDKKLSFSKSRDIKHNPDLNHYFASNTRQPLHTDYSYYETENSPEWLLLYCLKPSEYGGKTNLLSTETLTKILRKYNPNLLDKINVTVNWKYNGVDGDKLHQKKIFDGENINWNYWQIKEEYNSNEVISIRDEFFNFLENIIVEGGIYDFSKKWKSGDCIIFNDRLNLHGRDAFLGDDRWLKDHAFFNKKHKVE